MSWKSTGVLLAAAMVMFTFVWFIERPIRIERQRAANHLVLQGFDPASVNTIEIRPRNADEIQVERDGGAWRMTRPISYPAQSGPILALLDSLAQLTWQVRIPPGELTNAPDAQKQFGFADAPLEITTAGTGRSDKILIGQVGPFGDQVFLEVVGEPNIYRVSSDLLAAIPGDEDQWRDRTLLDLARVSFQSISVRAPSRGIDFELERDPTNRLWFMNKPVKARADNARIDRMIDRLQDLQVRRFVTDDPKADLEAYGLQTSPQTPDLDLSFRAGSNVVAELLVGSSPTNQPDFAFVRRSDPSNVVMIARDELLPWQGSYTNYLDYHFISVSPDTIGRILVQGDGKFAVEKQSDGQWLVRGSNSFPADATLMRDWLASFTNVQTQVEATVATDFAKYGLADPRLQYTLLAAGSGSNVIARIDFGAWSNGKVYERCPDEMSLNYISSWDFERLPRAAWQLRDRRVWSFDASNVLSLTIRQRGVTNKFLRDPSGDWTFAPGYHGPPIPNWPAVEEGAHRLGQLRAVFWAGVGEARLREFGFPEANFSLALELKAGDKTETREIMFGVPLAILLSLRVGQTQRRAADL